MLDRDLKQMINFPSALWETWSTEVAKIYPKGVEALTFKSIEGIEFNPLDNKASHCFLLSTFPHQCKRISFLEDINAVNSIDLTKIHNAGATIIQEVVYALQSFNFLEGKQKSVAVHLCTDSLFFANIAKLRALRYGLEKLNEAMGTNVEFKLYAHGSLREQSLFDPWVNLLRSTSTVAAAIIGGADFVSAPSHDQRAMQSMNKKADWKAIRQAQNTIQILLEESQLGFVKDAAYGCYSIENLTQQIIKKAWERFVDSADDFFNQEAKFAQEIEQVARRRYELARQRKSALTGVNTYANPNESLSSLYQNDLAITPDTSSLYPLRPLALEFEILRTSYNKQHEKIQIAVLTDAAKLSARINFVQNYFEIIAAKPEICIASNLTQQLENFKQQSFSHIILCAEDSAYLDQAQMWVKEFKKVGAQKIYLAGKPEGLDYNQLTTAGLTDCLYLGQNVYDVLSGFVHGDKK